LKKLALAGLVVAGALTLSGCGAANNGYDYIDYSQQSANDGGDWDWDLGHKSKYNNKTYCKGGTYTPVANGYTCTSNGIVTPVTPRPATPIKPVNPPKVQVPKPVAPAAPKQAAPKAPAPAPKAPAPAPKPPAAKTGK
jgi:hypothetical protein